MHDRESAAHQVDTLSILQTDQYGNPRTSQLEKLIVEVILVSKLCFRTLWHPSNKREKIGINFYMIWHKKKPQYQTNYISTCIAEDNVIMKSRDWWYKLLASDLLQWITRFLSTWWPIHVYILKKGKPLIYSLLIWLYYFSSTFTQPYLSELGKMSLSIYNKRSHANLPISCFSPVDILRIHGLSKLQNSKSSKKNY